MSNTSTQIKVLGSMSSLGMNQSIFLLNYCVCVAGLISYLPSGDEYGTQPQIAED